MSDPNPEKPKLTLQDAALILGVTAGLIYACGWLTRYIGLSSLGLGQFGSSKEKAVAAGIVVTLMAAPVGIFVFCRKRGNAIWRSVGDAFVTAFLSAALIASLKSNPILIEDWGAFAALGVRALGGQILVLLGITLPMGREKDIEGWAWPGFALVTSLFMATFVTSWFISRVPEPFGGLRCTPGEIELKDHRGIKKGFLMESDSDYASILIPKPGPPNPATEGDLLIIPKDQIQEIRPTKPIPYNGSLGLPNQPN